MAEAITVLTVLDQWELSSSVRDNTYFQKIVGMVDAKGDELWLPDSPKKYFYSGGYSKGYSKAEAQELELSIGGVLVERFGDFFENYFIGQRWYDVGLLAERYDCHRLAFWMKGILDEDGNSDRSLNLAQEVITKGDITREALGLGHLGVLGGCRSEEILAEHSMVGIDATRSLQAMGIHGPIAIASQAATIQHYMEISNDREYIGVDNYGVHVLTSV